MCLCGWCLPGCSYIGRRRYFVTAQHWARVCVRVASRGLPGPRRIPAYRAGIRVRSCCLLLHAGPSSCSALWHGVAIGLGRSWQRSAADPPASAAASVACVSGSAATTTRAPRPRSDRTRHAYIVGNPVRAGLVSKARAYPYSWSKGLAEERRPVRRWRMSEALVAPGSARRSTRRLGGDAPDIKAQSPTEVGPPSLGHSIGNMPQTRRSSGTSPLARGRPAREWPRAPRSRASAAIIPRGQRSGDGRSR